MELVAILEIKGFRKVSFGII